QAIPGPGGRTFFRQPSLVGCCLALSRDLYEDLRGFDTQMLSWGSEDVDFGLRAWLMGHAILLDPEPVVGHRFRHEADNTYSVPGAHVLYNHIRMARKNFGDDAWNDWARRFQSKFAPELWQSAWQLFEGAHENLAQEREFLMRRRTRDEY